MPCLEEPIGSNFELQGEVNKLTRMLCAICGKIERMGGSVTALSHEASEWWERHKLLDAERKSHAERSRLRKIQDLEEELRRLKK